MEPCSGLRDRYRKRGSPLVSLNLTREQLREVLSAVRQRRDAILHYGDGHLDRDLVETLSQILDLLEKVVEKLD